jgi:hypothetical protein
MKQVIFFMMICFTSISTETAAQGCVAIRSTGGMCTMDHAGGSIDSSKWTMNLNNRYFKSFRHFVGKEEQKHRVEEGTEVINHSYTLDVSLTRNINKWWSLTFAIPFLTNSRSSLYEHDGRTRHFTHSTGVGDIRITASRWLFDPAKDAKGNIQLGLGIKFPTGDYKYQDFFYKNDSTETLGPVDQSIQLGDGGTGISAELNTFYNISGRFSLYGNFYYLANPREQNGTSTARGGTPSASATRYGSSVMSVPDQYMIRAGANFTTKSITMSLGMRDECLPSEDLLGSSSGFRRPGYIISVEPGIVVKLKKTNVYAYVPVALVRNRTQSYADKSRTEATGIYTHGDAAFADYVINIGATFRF